MFLLYVWNITKITLARTPENFATQVIDSKWTIYITFNEDFRIAGSIPPLDTVFTHKKITWMMAMRAKVVQLKALEAASFASRPAFSGD